MSPIFIGNVRGGVGLYFHALNVNMKLTGKFLQFFQCNISLRWQHSRQALPDTSLTKLRFSHRKHGSESLTIVGNDVEWIGDDFYA